MFSAKVTLKFQDSMTGVTGGLHLNLGHSNIYDYANAMAEVKKAQAFLAHSKYDLILRIKILNFYMN